MASASQTKSGMFSSKKNIEASSSSIKVATSTSKLGPKKPTIGTAQAIAPGKSKPSGQTI